MVPLSFLFPLIVRTLITLPFPQTYFQPDEFYQALEPAHHYVFGYGYLTWEWRDLPYAPSGLWWESHIVGGRMRSWIWPSIFVGVYKVLQWLKVDKTELIVIAPRLVGIVVAALTDYYTYKLASKVLGPGASAPALFLSLTSLFNAHLLPRALSTSPESLLTTMALCYFPLPAFSKVTVAASDSLVPAGEKKNTGEGCDTPMSKPSLKMSYIAMDRIPPHFTQVSCSDNLPLSIALATVALCIRPTTGPLWTYLGFDLIGRIWKCSGASASLKVMIIAALSLTMTFATCTLLDYTYTGRLYFPAITFIHHNIVQNVSAFYGSTNHFYHLTQSLPILLFPLWYWWLRGFVSCLVPSTLLASGLVEMDRPEPLRLLARAVTFSIAVLSLSPHSEWRFLHPFLPSLLLFAIPSLTSKYVPSVLGCYRFIHSLRQYTRIPKMPFYLVLFAPIVPFVYLNTFHGSAQVEVMNVLRRGRLGSVQSLVVLAPCHSVPWQSSLHSPDLGGWFLTCEPPIGVNSDSHRTQQSFFYQSPITYLTEVFPYPPAQLRDIANITASPIKPSHLILFGELLDRSEVISGKRISVQDELTNLGYKQIWYGWNGFDMLQDEDERRGGLTVWRLIT
ncbi:uncharacterized protein IL334_000414 [Kwoniella shivajii]|uniref:Mannosyltransferase n=1 Tax=Kwoniella shivajii TaxID=564305 RepID=A0ABZ1CQ52_9TREE|nr:hypothetical protein IL334_000414 [Kwoniella shivajii]